ncbi:peptidase M14 [Virgibacillus profundi]|uniref:Peptidase M14 n=1 Tax=Virgibacillus profundi TaxID=2024555 RepID=A0A2A2IE73_9BACI|nr:M14 family metallopeptidase [Virgibacillus profundi]PAV29440.1 peptidase M14 [Virgibacillus profundi]PXY53609.1 LysM peptidoglycan-binding domain-containing protein [Virgibacillus profundi]
MEIFVRSGDTFWYYSQLFGIPMILIERSNPQIAANQLMVGQQVQIPGYVLSGYTIKENDSLWSIAINNNISIASLLLVNPMISATNLQIGQEISIPQQIRELIVTDVNNYTYEKMLADIQQLLAVYPFIFRQTIGSSVMGKELIELQIGTGEKQVHLNGSFHANEWITTPVIMSFINEYALSLTNNTPIRGIFMLPLYMDTLLSIVPMVNPDGVDLVLKGSSAAGEHQNEVLAINNQNEDFSNWKANINGVDLNNQYPALWEVEAARKPTTPQPRDYPGPHPLSEPESIAMAELANSRDFLRVNAFHTQGEVIYWGFEGLEPPVSEVIVNEYARVSGYLPVQYIDSFAGYKDWFIQEFRRPGFTIELGTGINPLPIGQFPEIYQESLGIMLANLYL